MQIKQAIALLEPAFLDRYAIEVWADLGCGTGLFTKALASLLTKGSTIHAVDTDVSSLNQVDVNPEIHLRKIAADFNKEDLLLSDLDGVIMANSLHYVANKNAFLQKLRKWIKKDARLILIEYDTDQSNRWVPYPLSFNSALQLFGYPLYKSIKKIGEQPSIYNRAGMYAAVVEF